MPTAIEVKALGNYRLWVKYSDGIEGIVDLSDFAGDGVFAAWDDYREFRKVHIGAGGALVWNDQVDMCSDAIYLRLTGRKPEELFPRRADREASPPGLAGSQQAAGAVFDTVGRARYDTR